MPNMATQSVQVMVEGGKATAAPPLGPALGPLGVNIGQVVADINKKTASFAGMQVPVKVMVDKDTRQFTLEVGVPPATALIKKEAGVEKGAHNPKDEKVADVLIEQVIKIAKMKEPQLLGKSLKHKVKEIVGTCRSMGILVEGMPAEEALKEIDAGKFDKEITSGKTELGAEELRLLEEERKKLRAELERKRVQYQARAQAIMKEMEGKEKNKMRAKMLEEKIPKDIVDELIPPEKAPATPGKK